MRLKSIIWTSDQQVRLKEFVQTSDHCLGRVSSSSCLSVSLCSFFVLLFLLLFTYLLYVLYVLYLVCIVVFVCVPYFSCCSLSGVLFMFLYVFCLSCLLCVCS